MVYQKTWADLSQHKVNYLEIASLKTVHEEPTSVGKLRTKNLQQPQG